MVHYLPRYASNVDENLSGVVYGVTLILLMYVAPGGLVGLARRLWSRTRARATAADAPGTRPPHGTLGEAMPTAGTRELTPQ